MFNKEDDENDKNDNDTQKDATILIIGGIQLGANGTFLDMAVDDDAVDFGIWCWKRRRRWSNVGIIFFGGLDKGDG